METYIETFALLFFRYAQADDHIDDLEADEAADAADNERGDDGAELHQEIRVGSADFLDVENTGQQSADDAANAVNAECIERVVVAEGLLDRCRCDEAENPRSDAYDEGTGGADEPGGRRNGGQPRDCPRGDTQHRRFALAQPLRE